MGFFFIFQKQTEDGIENKDEEDDGASDDDENISFDGKTLKKGSLCDEDVLRLIQLKMIHPGPVPPSKVRRLRANYWKNGIQFLYWNAELTKIFQGWYFCLECDDYVKHIKKLSSGTTGLKTHVESHKDRKYIFKECELKLFVERATAFGEKNGAIKMDNFSFPSSKNWFVIIHRLANPFLFLFLT